MFHLLRKIVLCNIFLYNERLLIDFSLQSDTSGFIQL